VEEGRKSNGQFGPGSGGGPGAPRGNRNAHWNKLLNDSTTDDQFKAIWEKALALAAEGDGDMIRFVCERLAGKVPQAMEHSGPEGESLVINVLLGTPKATP
jgi:hypothetical protein